MSKLARVLIADDEPDLIEDYHSAFAPMEPEVADLRLAALQDELFGSQHANGSLPQVEVVAVSQGEAAVQEISHARSASQPFSVAFIDVRMPPGISGVEAAAKIREIDPDLPIVIVTAYTDIQTIDLAERIPPADRLFVLQKPFHTTEIQQLTIALTAIRDMSRGAAVEGGRGDPQLLEEILRGLPGGVALFDEQGRLVEKNRELEALFPELKEQLSIGASYSSLRDSLSERLMADRVLKRPSQDHAAGGAHIVEPGGPGLKCIDGNRWMMISEQTRGAGGAVVQFLDVTAMKQAEQRREINNTMTHLSRFAEELLSRVKEGTFATQHRLSDPRTGEGEADKVQLLFDELKPLTQSLQLSPKGALLDALVNEVAAEVAPDLPDTIALETVSSVGLWPIFVDGEQVKRAIRALIVNAAEAIAESGEVVVETANIRVTRDVTLAMPGLKEGDYVCATVTDNGAGLSPGIINRCFMPYFTTKDPKMHRGMGLTTAFSIITQSGGQLFIDSDGQAQTQARLFFPRGPVAAVSRTGAPIRH